MSNTATAAKQSTLNLPLILLWAVAVIVTGIGAYLLLAGNAAQVAFYTAQGSEYALYLANISQSTIGGLLLAAGVVGILLALATQARNRAAAIQAQAAAAEFDAVFGDIDDEEFEELDLVVDEADVEVPVDAPAPAAAAPAAEAPAAPAAPEAPEAPAAPEAPKA
ncbi:hypothetical protein SAMN05428970_2577 [Agromyces sp. CF514]|uniref:hypothetical protein n=1 Tax=Agromyces sp. CF514 TaxID=1881031 RepID=UPI0008EEA396|nr:hypothetical protein [Agromyces sp. CF514]SFR79539.1 hypothetical protein SAMN05428970_2577 [Agromyces sp. CF514]